MGLVNLAWVWAKILLEPPVKTRTVQSFFRNKDDPQTEESITREITQEESTTDPRIQVIQTECLDITRLRHNIVPRSQCKLYHTADACDRVEHFIQEHSSLLDQADRIFIERQPLGGLIHVEQLLYFRFRHKAVLCSPVKMHKWLGIRGLTYEQRKEQTVLKAKPYLSKFADFNETDRQHDMADAMCFILLQAELELEQIKQEQKQQSCITQSFSVVSGKDPLLFLEQFRWNAHALSLHHSLEGDK